MNKLDFWINRDWSYSGFTLHITNISEDKRALMQPATFAVLENEAAKHTEPSMVLTIGDAQRLIDSLYDAGLRPSKANNGEGVLAHLSDMRAIVSSKLKIDLK